MDAKTANRVRELAAGLAPPPEAEKPVYKANRHYSRAPRDQGEWRAVSQNTPRERALWQALYSACGGNFKFALEVANEVTLWPRDVLPPEGYLKRWSLELDENKATPDPALERLLSQRLEKYKSTQHWRWLQSQMKAGKKMADELSETGSIKDGVVLSYLGNNINYGMDKGEHAQKQATTASVRVGKLRITSNHLQAAITPAQAKRAKKLAPAPKMIEAEVKVVG